MYLLAHLLAGILTGILLAYFFRDTRLILACAFGSILPDLVDKPVGILLFPATFGNGRIFGHTLLVAGLILFLALLVYTRYPRAGTLFLAVAAGIITHQVLDAMWLEPRNWYWPALGPFTGHSRPDFFLDAFLRTIKNPTEWLAGGIILLVLIIYSIPRYRDRYLPVSGEPGTRQPSTPLLLFILATGALVLAIGVYYRKLLFP